MESRETGEQPHLCGTCGKSFRYKRNLYEAEDIHICGLCRAQFSDVEIFIQHKKHKCPVKLARQQETQGDVGRKFTSDQAQAAPQPSFETEQFSQSLLHAIDRSSVQGSGEDKVPVVLEQAGTTLGSFLVTHQQHQEPGPISQHQYVILPCQQDVDPGICSQTVQTDSQTYSTLETVYTLNSHPLQQPISQISSTLQEPVNFKTALQTEEPVNYRKDDHIEKAVIYTSNNEFQEPDNQRISEQSNCVTVDTLQDPICYSGTEENLQPVNYSKNNLLQNDNSEMINLLQNDQSVVIQNLDNLNLQQTETPIESLSQTHQFNSKAAGNKSVLREHLIGDQNSQSDETANPESLSESAHTRKQSQDAGPKDVIGRKRSAPVPPDPLIFQYTMRDIKEEPKPAAAKKAKKVPLEKKFTCKFENCTYRTAYLKDLERHSRIHTGDKPYKCPQCPKAFSRTDKLTVHLRYHMDDRMFKCTLCNYSAVENGSLKKHLKIHRDERPFSCQVCPYKSRSSSQLQIHLRTHTGDTPYSCKFCDAVFKVSSDLHRHIRIHTGEKPFKCKEENCNYRCAVKSNLKSHYQTHHSQKIEHKCSVCDFTSSSRKAFFEHKKTHNSNPELTCKTCGYQCSNKSALRHHGRLHSDGERFQCKHCDYKSIQLGNVQAHMTRKHPNKVTRRLLKKKWKKSSNDEITIKEKAEEAGSQMSEKKNYAKGKNQPRCVQNFKCDRCPLAFVREDSLKCHIRQHDDTSLSTAYAVLKLQQPVIKKANSQVPADSKSITSSSDKQSERDSSGEFDMNTEPPTSNNQTVQLQGNMDNLIQGQVSTNQGQTVPNQTVTLGINDILMAAGMSGLNSAGNSPTSKLPPSSDTPVQDLSLNNSIDQSGELNSSSGLQCSGNLGIQNAVVAPSPHDVPSVQVMQNISLPYIRLPNGQVLILTGQTSMNQMITQPDGPVQSDSALIPNTVELQSQLLSHPAGSQQQIVQCAADSTVPTPPPHISGPQPQGAVLTQPGIITAQDSALTQQQGAIPIQLILPSDSQQTVPIVSQLLNSVMNRTSNDGCGPNQGSVMLHGVNQTTGADNVQNFVLQIPSQSGISRDPSGNLGESQSFVLQIPGATNFK